MFSRKRPSQIAHAVATSLMAHGTRITGDVRFEGSLFLEGQVDGQIVATAPGALLTIGEQGLVQGDIRVPAAIIHGSVCGDVHATEHLELAATARVTGDVCYRSIVVAAGAKIHGNLQHRAADGDNTAALPNASPHANATALPSDPAPHKTTGHAGNALDASPARVNSDLANDSSASDLQPASHAMEAPSDNRPAKRGRDRPARGKS